MTHRDQLFLNSLESVIAANLKNEEFGVKALADHLSYNRSHLHRKIQHITGMNLSEFIRNYRLDLAKRMILEKEMKPSEVWHEVGFQSLSYFSKSFKKRFGQPPSSIKPNDQKLRDIHENGNYFTFGVSILLLPFRNLSPSKEIEYLAQGLKEAIGRDLSAVEKLHIISTLGMTSFSSYKDIRKRLGVTHILKGSLQQQDEVLRIEIRLIDTTEGRQIWTKHYNRKALDMLRVQSDIAQNVISSLQSNTAVNQKATLTRRTSYDSKAYDYYLQGMYHMNQIGDCGTNKSLTYFKKAIDLDPSIAPAYAAIANAYHMKASIFSASMDSNEVIKKAETYLDTAIKLDPTWPFNYTMKGFQLTFFNWNFAEADRFYRSGITAKQPLNYLMYRDYLQFMNRHREAMEISLKINELHPFYPNVPMIMPYYYNRMYEKGINYIEERLAYFPTQHLAYDGAGFFMLNAGFYDRAIELFLQLIKIKGKRFPRTLGWMAAAHAHKGEIGKAKKILFELKKLSKVDNSGSPKWFIGIIYAALGKYTNAIDWLQRAIDDHEMEVPWLVSEPQLYPLHGLPDFDFLVQKVDFPKTAYPIQLPRSL